MAATLGLAATLIVARPAAAQSPAAARFYEQHNLQSNATEPTLLNAWGLVSGPTSPWWVVNNGDDTARPSTPAPAPAQGTTCS